MIHFLTACVIERHSRSTFGPPWWAVSPCAQRSGVDSIDSVSQCCPQAYSSVNITPAFHRRTSAIKVLSSSSRPKRNYPNSAEGEEKQVRKPCGEKRRKYLR